MSVSSILGAAETSTQSGTSKVTEDKEMFLKLLVAQLTYQDPLSPQEDSEFIAQLAQFTQVEELQKVNTNLDTMVTYENQRLFTSAVNMINQIVVGAGDSIRKFTASYYQYDDDGNQLFEADGETPLTKEGPYTDPFYYRCDYAVTDVTLTVTNSNGLQVHSESLPAMNADVTYSYTWDGLNSYGAEVGEGMYTISVTAKDANGQSHLVTTEVSGKVQAVENIGGDYYLYLTDGRTVKYLDVGMVGATSSSVGN